MPYQYDVFISYSSTDRLWAIKLYNDLKAKNIEPFLDQQRLDVGKPWEPALAKAIQTSQHFVVLWSQHAEQSRWVGRELGVFEAIVDPATSGHNQEDRRFIFLMLEGDNPAYTSLQVISDLREAQSYAGGADAVAPGLWQDVVQKIVDAIRANDSSIPLPVAVLAMTKQELGALDPNEEHGVGPSFTALLRNLGIVDEQEIAQGRVKEKIEGYYGDQHTDWHPFGGPFNVRQLLDNLLDNINNGLATPFRCEYIDSRFWTDHEVALKERRKLLSTLSVVAIDPLSLYAERVYQRLVFLSQCFSSEKSVILVLTPFLMPAPFLHLSTLIEQRGSPFFDSYYNPPVPYNTVYATLGVNVCDERDVKRFLRTSLGQYMRSNSPRAASPYLRS
jgi:hypothetical protein